MRQYDKKELLSLITKAIGQRSIKSFALDAGLSPDYMYRLVKGRLEDSPRRNTLRKISEASNGTVTYRELVKASGYEATSTENTFSDKCSSMKALLLLSLANSGLNFGINNAFPKSMLSINCQNAEINRWIFMDLNGPSDKMRNTQFNHLVTYACGFSKL